jgi:hypothetical protein
LDDPTGQRLTFAPDKSFDSIDDAIAERDRQVQLSVADDFELYEPTVPPI